MRERETMNSYQNTRAADTRMDDAGIADTEITLGVGQLLGLFFALVILCGLALGTGYWLGRNSAKQAPAAATTARGSGKPGVPRPAASLEPRSSLRRRPRQANPQPPIAAGTTASLRRQPRPMLPWPMRRRMRPRLTRQCQSLTPAT